MASAALAWTLTPVNCKGTTTPSSTKYGMTFWEADIWEPKAAVEDWYMMVSASAHRPLSCIYVAEAPGRLGP